MVESEKRPYVLNHNKLRTQLLRKSLSDILKTVLPTYEKNLSLAILRQIQIDLVQIFSLLPLFAMETRSTNKRIQTDSDVPIKTSSDVMAKLNQLISSMDALNLKVAKQNEQIERALTLLNQQADVISKHEGVIKELGKENTALKKEVKVLRQNINSLDQYGRRRNVELHGVQQRPGEDVVGLVREIGNILQLPTGDIDVAHRMKKKSNKRNPIIVQFLSRSSRDAWLSKRKTGITSNNVVRGSDDSAIYINVNLSPYQSDLYWQARKFKITNNYRFCWVNGRGDIFLKRDENTNALLVSTVEDLLSSGSIVDSPAEGTGNGEVMQAHLPVAASVLTSNDGHSA